MVTFRVATVEDEARSISAEREADILLLGGAVAGWLEAELIWGPWPYTEYE